ncbi:glycoside hydrolase family 2 TIM barrel-domain containing protein [Mangrovibacterium marinum]|uniref:Beta-galactosidase n=1 Tax=Mangrovibacterium marinum TaxID=1639118 RepID=A0A2T5BXP8_9BACT|nr:glycoside hydrolase family 2 TIM barrel-domain containing protein [Mangrovibacterium marinum]PTN05916.1 beta-galactosidase [Mangrovibacterium marinum]
MRLLNLLLFFGLVLSACNHQADGPDRKILFDADWHFHRGAIENGENPELDHADWRVVDLPHDWSVEPLAEQIPDSVVGPFSKASVGGFATGQTVGGEGWYRKTFVVAPEDAEKRHELYFEGVYNQSEVWVNGKKAYTNVYGYSSFRFDITSFCKPVGETNVIAVKVVNEGQNSRWYSGSGIYRHLWLLKTPKTYLEDWGTFIATANIEDNKAYISVSATVINGDGNYDLSVRLLAPDGREVIQSGKNIRIENAPKREASFKLEVNSPLLWSPETPHLYEARIILSQSGKEMDRLSVSFGIRTIQFSVEKGFELNGQPLLLKGGCVHHDNGLLGAAAFDDAEERKIRLLKENGYNAVRVAHNPMSESFMNACDRLGMLVIDEAFDQWNGGKNPDDYHNYFKEWSARDIKALVLRDRNHPSVILWSIGNEIRERITEEGKETAGYLKNEILKYDSTRLITAGVNKHWNKDRTAMLPLDNAMYHLDVLGYNYIWRFYEEEHRKYPDRVIIGTESVATEASENWDKVEALPYVVGDFVWTAMDYLGESGLGSTVEVSPQENVHQFMGWPWFNGWCGDLDLIGTKKPQSYYRDILWRETQITMAVEMPVAEGKIRKVSFWGWPDEALSWTFPGMEGKTVKVNVYTREPNVKLYLNGELIGEQATDEKYKATFEVSYQPGKLEAVAVDNSQHVATAALETTGEPVALRLTSDRTTLEADGQQLAYVLIELVDGNGNVVVNNDRKLKLSCNGAGRMIASGNASPMDMASFGSLEPSLFMGRAMAILRAPKKPGEIKLMVDAENMGTSTLILQSK